MSDRSRDFDAFEAERSDEPIRFRLGGKEWRAPYANDAATFLAFIRSQEQGGSAVISGFDTYLTSMLAEPDREPFRLMLERRHVKQSTLMELVGWVFSEATGDPFAEGQPSPEQPSPTGAKPRVVSLSGASSREPSASAAS